MNKEKDKKPDRASANDPAHEAEDAESRVGPYNPALGEIYQQLYPEIRRPKPNQEAIAAALRAMQRLTMKMDSETAVEDTAAGVVSSIPCHACGHRNRLGNRFCAMCGASVLDEVEQPSVVEDTSEEVRQEEVQQEEAGQQEHVRHPESDAATETNIFPAGKATAVAATLQADVHAETSPESPSAAHAIDGASAGLHHYHHHYHHHYFPGGIETPPASQRAAAPESVREADRLRVAAAAKGEPISRSEAAVRRLTQEWVLACNTRQLDELLELYAPDALVLRSNLPLLRGASQVREFFFSALESGLGEVALEPIRVEVVGDVAHEVGRYSALVPGTTGKRREERGKYLWVFAKQNGGEWKLISECWSSDLTLTTAESDLPKAATPALSKVGRK